MKKKNLTLSIDKDVLEKAKKLGLNFSNITENILKTTSLIKDKEIVSNEDLRDFYRKVFLEISSIMNQWGVLYFIRIGSNISNEEFREQDGKVFFEEISHIYYLDPSGKIEHYIGEPIEQTVRIWKLNDEDWPTQYFYKSEKIISNLIEMIYKTTERNKEKLEDLEILKNILEKLKNKRGDKSEI